MEKKVLSYICMKLLIDKIREFNLETRLAFFDYVKAFYGGFFFFSFFFLSFCVFFFLSFFLSFFLPPPVRPNAGYGLLILEVFKSHDDATQSAELLWTSDQRVAETSTRQHTTLTTERHPWPRRDFDGVKEINCLKYYKTKIFQIYY